LIPALSTTTSVALGNTSCACNAGLVGSSESPLLVVPPAARFSRLGPRHARRSEELETLHRSYHPISGRPVSRVVGGSVRPTKIETFAGETVRNPPPKEDVPCGGRTLIVEQKRKLFLGPRARSRGFVLIRYRFVKSSQRGPWSRNINLVAFRGRRTLPNE